MYHAEIVDKYKDYTHIYTDGSKDGDRAALAFVSPSFTFSKRLPDKASIFTAELEALVAALRYIKMSSISKKFILFVDSKSALQALMSKWDHPSISQIMKFLVDIHSINKNIVFCWLPSHTGIPGNEKADKVAKEALQKDISICHISFTDARQYIGNHINNLWQEEWDKAVNNKLRAIKPFIGEQQTCNRCTRREEVVLCRLRIGHSHLTHSYLLKGEPFPECITCQCRLTIKHIMLDCIEYDFIRTTYFKDNLNLKSIFENVSSEDIILFVKRAGLFSKL